MCDRSTIYLSTFLLIEIWIFKNIFATINKAARNILIYIFNVCVHEYLMLVYLRIKFMGHRLYWLALVDFAKQFSKTVVLIYTSSSSVWLFSLALQCTCYCQSSKISWFWWMFNDVSLQVCLSFHWLLMRLSTFPYIYLLIYILLCEMPKTFFIFLLAFSVCFWFIGVLYTFWYIALYRLYILHISFLIHFLAFTVPNVAFWKMKILNFRVPTYQVSPLWLDPTRKWQYFQ